MTLEVFIAAGADNNNFDRNEDLRKWELCLPDIMSSRYLGIIYHKDKLPRLRRLRYTAFDLL
jgi:hypothetical protein